MLHRYRQSRRSPQLAVADTLRASGRALLDEVALPAIPLAAAPGRRRLAWS